MSFESKLDMDYIHKYGVVEGKLYFSILREPTSSGASVHHYAQSEDGTVEPIKRSVINELFKE